MIKEFCVRYEPDKFWVCTVKMKTGEDIFTQKVMINDEDGYIKALHDLGYIETFLVFSSAGKLCKWWWD